MRFTMISGHSKDVQMISRNDHSILRDVHFLLEMTRFSFRIFSDPRDFSFHFLVVISGECLVCHAPQVWEILWVQCLSIMWVKLQVPVSFELGSVWLRLRERRCRATKTDKPNETRRPGPGNRRLRARKFFRRGGCLTMLRTRAIA